MIRKLLVPPDVDDDGIDYPDSDGKPIGETEYHVDAIFALKDALQSHFRARTDVHVAADMFLYFEKGNPAANKSPDVMVTKGVGNHKRRTFKTWVEGTAPQVIFEIVSRKTRKEDTVVKPPLYARLGVKEYFLFDPVGDARLEPRYQAFHLQRGRLVPMKPESAGGFTSVELGLRFVPDGHLLRALDATTGQPILLSLELSEAVDEEKRRADEEKRRADELEAEVQRLRAELGKPRKRR